MRMNDYPLWPKSKFLNQSIPSGQLDHELMTILPGDLKFSTNITLMGFHWITKTHPLKNPQKQFDLWPSHVAKSLTGGLPSNEPFFQSMKWNVWGMEGHKHIYLIQSPKYPKIQKTLYIIKYSNKECHFPVPFTYVVHPHQSFPKYRQGESSFRNCQRTKLLDSRPCRTSSCNLSWSTWSKNIGGGYDKNLEVSGAIKITKYHFPTLVGQSWML